MRSRREENMPVGMGPYDIPYDRSEMGQGISGIPEAIGGMKKMSLEFAEPTPQEAPQIPQGAGVPPAGMAQGGIPPAGMQQPMDPSMGGGQAPLLAGLQQPQGMDSSMLSDQDLMAMVGEDFDPTEMQGQEMFDASMQDPMMQQQLMLAARRMMGGGGF
jgi:hypothetical protein